MAQAQKRNKPQGKGKKQRQQAYGATDIQVLEGLAGGRRRRGMYVGGTDIRALHHLIYEVGDKSLDDVMA